MKKFYNLLARTTQKGVCTFSGEGTLPSVFASLLKIRQTLFWTLLPKQTANSYPACKIAKKQTKKKKKQVYIQSLWVKYAGTKSITLQRNRNQEEMQPASKRKGTSNMRKWREIRLSCACAKYHPGPEFCSYILFYQMILSADSKGSDPRKRMRRLIWASCIRICPKKRFRGARIA